MVLLKCVQHSWTGRTAGEFVMYAEARSGGSDGVVWHPTDRAG